MVNELEQQLKKYPDYWITRLTYNAVRGRIKMSLVADPEKEEVVANVTFYKVRDFHAKYHGKNGEESDTSFVPFLVSITDNPEGDMHRYIITHDTQEISFVSDETPDVDWIDDDQMYREWEEEQMKKDWD